MALGILVAECDSAWVGMREGGRREEGGEEMRDGPLRTQLEQGRFLVAV